MGNRLELRDLDRSQLLVGDDWRFLINMRNRLEFWRFLSDTENRLELRGLDRSQLLLHDDFRLYA